MGPTLRASLSLFALATFAAIRPVDGCTMIPTTPPPVWYTDKGFDTGTGMEKIAEGIDLLGLFGPTTLTNCACGTAFVNGVAIPHTVLDAYVTITNTVTHTDVIVPAFTAAFATPSQFVTNALNTNVPAISGNGPPANWTGFGFPVGSVSPFIVPTLGPNEIFKLWFDYEVPVVNLSAFLAQPTRVAAGTLNPDGTFDDGHPITVVDVAPEPASFALLLSGGIALLVVARHRRQSKKVHSSGSSEAKG
jgi:hypothetical protein